MALQRCGQVCLQAVSATAAPALQCSPNAAADTLSDSLGSMAVSLDTPCAQLLADSTDTLMVEHEALDPALLPRNAPERLDGRTLRELVCAAEQAAESGLPSPFLTSTGGMRLEPARPVRDLYVIYPQLGRAQASNQDLALTVGNGSTNESSDDDDGSCSSPPACLDKNPDGTDITPKSLPSLLDSHLLGDRENVGKSARRVQFSASSPRVQLIPACAGAIRRPDRRPHRRRQLSAASRMAIEASLALGSTS